MEALLNSFLLVFASEMGDKTQLLALILASRFQKPWTIMAGIFVATVLNHALAAWIGQWSAGFLDSGALKWSLVLIFVAFGIWILFPDKESDCPSYGRWGALATTVVAFFLAEMGDKTQLATVALGARYQSLFIVTLGTTLGMMASNGLAVYFGARFLKKMPMKWVRIGASTLFFLFAIAIVFGML